jgi:hypothetical protein
MRAFSASVVTYGLGAVLVFGGFLFLPQYLQLVLGLSPLEAGLWTLPWALGFVVGSNLTPLVVGRVRPALVMAAGLALAAVGFGVFTRVDAASGFAVIVTASTIFSLGTAPVFTLTNDLIIGAAPPERAGAAAGISETAFEFGGALGIAVFGSIGAAIYRGAIGLAIPAGTPAEAAHAARETLGGAVQVAGQLPGRLGPALVDAAARRSPTAAHCRRDQRRWLDRPGRVRCGPAAIRARRRRTLRSSGSRRARAARVVRGAERRRRTGNYLLLPSRRTVLLLPRRSHMGDGLGCDDRPGGGVDVAPRSDGVLRRGEANVIPPWRDVALRGRYAQGEDPGITQRHPSGWNPRRAPHAPTGSLQVRGRG